MTDEPALRPAGRAWRKRDRAGDKISAVLLTRRGLLGLAIAVAAAPLGLEAPCGADAEPASIPLIGVVSSGERAPSLPFLAAFREGLSQAGYVIGRNVNIEVRWAMGHYDRLPAFVADLVQRRVVVIVALGGNAPVLAAKSATATIPIVFVSGGDPVKAGIVASLNRPGGNVTGINEIFTALVPKQLQLLHELVPSARIAALVNPNYPDVVLQRQELRQAEEAIKQDVRAVEAGSDAQINEAFTGLGRMNVNALLVANDPFFLSRRDRLVALAARQGLPTTYFERHFVLTGGLMSYGPNLVDVHRRCGASVGKILNGVKPADLPVEQPTTFELIINAKTAKALGLSIPPSLLARADQVIE